MTSPLLQAVYLFAACWLLAQVEIQIEGPHGWAEKLPTWRADKPWLLKLTNGKPVTGYHFYLTAFLIGIFQLPVALLGFSRPLEARCLSFYLLTTVIWDFQWFVWNPVWGVKRYFTDRVWWFPKRFLGLPVEYFLGYSGSFAVTALLDPAGLRNWAVLAALLLVLSAAAAFASLALGIAPERAAAAGD